MRFTTVLSAVVALFFTLYLSGCASYSALPAGTRMSIGENPPGVVNRQIIEVPSSEASPYQSFDYVIGPNDVLFINVNGMTEFGNGMNGSIVLGTNTNSMGANTKVSGYRVDGRGYIYIPLAGELHVGGLTLSSARSVIASTMVKYFNNPYVVVEIAEYRNRQIFVFGAVTKPGPILLGSGGMNLAQAIAVAALRDTGYNLKQVRIIRSLTPTKGELLVVNFERVMHGKAVPMQLQEGDIIYIPKSVMGSWNDVISDLLPSLQGINGLLQPFVNIKYLKN